MKELDEIRARIDAATPGEWKWQRSWKEDEYSSVYNGCMGCLVPGVLWYGMDGEEGIYCPNKADSELIAHSRTDMDRMERALRLIFESSDNGFQVPYIENIEAIMRGEKD